MDKLISINNVDGGKRGEFDNSLVAVENFEFTMVAELADMFIAINGRDTVNAFLKANGWKWEKVSVNGIYEPPVWSLRNTKSEYAQPLFADRCNAAQLAVRKIFGN